MTRPAELPGWLQRHLEMDGVTRGVTRAVEK